MGAKMPHLRSRIGNLEPIHQSENPSIEGSQSLGSTAHPYLTRIFPHGVLRFTVMDNSDFSPNRLTVSIDSSYHKETIHSPHFKQRGSLWPFRFSCSCSCSSSYSAWCALGTFICPISSLPTQKQGSYAPRSNVFSSHAPRLIAPPAASPIPPRQV